MQSIVELLMDLTELARELGMSTSTVSRALNHPEMVAPATRLKVLSAVEQFGCRPNTVARSLRTLQTRIIGVVVPNLRDDLFTEIIRAADRSARSHGYTVLVSSLQDDHLGVRHALRILLERKVGGIIHCPLQTDDEYELLLSETELPIVELDRLALRDRTDAVVLDFPAVANLAAQHLVELGHRRIAIVLGPRDLYQASETLAAFRQILAGFSIELPPTYVEHAVLEEQSGFAATERLLALEARPTAIILEQAEVAAGGLRAIRDCGIRVPKDLSIVVVGNARWAHYVDAPLTVVSRPTAQMATLAVEWLIERLASPTKNWVPRIEVLQPELIVRESTAQVELIKIWKSGSPADKENVTILNWLDDWNSQHPDRQAEAQFFDKSSYEDASVLTLAFASGNAPDLFWAAPGQFRQFVQCGFAADLSDLFTEEFRNDLSAVAIEGVSLEGKPYAIPFEQEPLGLFFNRRLLAQANVDVPRTWDELLTASEKLKACGITPIVIETRSSNYQNFNWLPFLWQNGVDPVTLEARTADFDAEGTIKALELWGTLIRLGYAPKFCYELTASIEATAFGDGRAAMQITGFWAVDFLRKHRPSLDFSVAPLPIASGGNPASAYGGWLLMVNRRSTHREIAKKLAAWMFISGTERAVEWCTCAGTKFSPRQSVNAQAQAFFDQTPHSIFRDEIMPVARPEPRYPREIEAIINDALQQVMFRDVPAKEAAAEAQRRLEKALRNQSDRAGSAVPKSEAR